VGSLQTIVPRAFDSAHTAHRHFLHAWHDSDAATRKAERTRERERGRSREPLLDLGLSSSSSAPKILGFCSPQRDGAHLVGVDRAVDVGAGEQHPHCGLRPGRDGRDLPLRRRVSGAGAAGEALGQRPAPLPPHQDLRARAAQDGRPRPRRGHHRGHGAHAGQV
jgi:hypothetical protein